MKAARKFFRVFFYLVLVLVILFVVFYLINPARDEVPKTVSDDSSIPHVTLDGHTFHSEVFGPDTAQVVIVLHGGPGNDYRYLLPLQALSDEYKVVFYDQRGTGLSPRVAAEELTLESSREDLLLMVRHYSPDHKVHIIGHSWGAMLACYFTAAYPEIVDKLVLAEPGFLTTEMAKEFEERTSGFSVELNIRNMMEMGKLFFQALHIRGPDGQAMKDYLFTHLVTMDIPDHPLSGYFCDGASMMTKLPRWRFGMTASLAIQGSASNERGETEIDLISGIEHYPDTILFFSGSCNTLIGPEFQQKYLHYFPRNRFVVIDDAGHNMLTEQSSVCLPEIRSFFRKP